MSWRRGRRRGEALTGAAFAADEDEDSDEAEGSEGKKGGEAGRRQDWASLVVARRNAERTRRAAELALDQDPQVFDYDANWENSQQEHSYREREVKALQESKYIASLSKQASERKAERERVLERKIQKEREREEASGEFRDKETFVTAAYQAAQVQRGREQEAEREREAKEQCEVAKRGKSGQGSVAFFRTILQYTGAPQYPVEGVTGNPSSRTSPRPENQSGGARPNVQLVASTEGRAQIRRDVANLAGDVEVLVAAREEAKRLWKEQRRTKYLRRNTAEDIEAARARYFERGQRP
mmetsp:Transcript_8600/g.17420  ORF Transcript_8600/g.17420 Transcript_8600/m.17420 type:complete len:297 (+) Transcript_8600:295-1185(+)